MTSYTELERQALGSIADGLAGSDPRLASMLTIVSRLAAGEQMPARQKTRVRRRRPAAHRLVPSVGDPGMAGVSDGGNAMMARLVQSSGGPG